VVAVTTQKRAKTPVTLVVEVKYQQHLLLSLFVRVFGGTVGERLRGSWLDPESCEAELHVSENGQ
jgi:hypothetical protein